MILLTHVKHFLIYCVQSTVERILTYTLTPTNTNVIITKKSNVRSICMGIFLLIRFLLSTFCCRKRFFKNKKSTPITYVTVLTMFLNLYLVSVHAHFVHVHFDLYSFFFFVFFFHFVCLFNHQTNIMKSLEW